MDHRRHVLTQPVKPVEAEQFLMRGDLQDAVGRGIADRPAGLDMARAQPRNHLGARDVFIAKDARGPRRLGNAGGQVRRKGRAGVGEIMPVPGHRHPGDFPMPRGGVLAARHLGRGAPQALRRGAKAGRILAPEDYAEILVAKIFLVSLEPKVDLRFGRNVDSIVREEDEPEFADDIIVTR